MVSQFTLAGDLCRGNRPGFSGAADPALAVPLYERFCARIAEHGVPVQTGTFGAHMDVALVNDGPVTIWMDTSSTSGVTSRSTRVASTLRTRAVRLRGRAWPT